MEDKRWPRQIMTMVITRQQRGQLKLKWEKKVERIMKQRNLTFKDTVNQKL
jgi:hypothetical protein